jgi:ubiquinone biosynthesis protein
MLVRPRYLRRYRQIAEILADYGFGAFLAQLGFSERLNLPRRIRRRKLPEETEIPLPRRVRLAIEELGPTFVKFGQILSTRPDLLPPDFIEELSHLQDKVAPVSWEKARAVLEADLGAPAEQFFFYIDPTPIASASLAQVHEAILRTGEQVVIKIQRPDIEATINTDLDILNDFAIQVQQRTALGERYAVADVAEEYAVALRIELDFRREARSAERFAANFSKESNIYIPKIYWDFTTRRVLVQERIKGIKIDDLPALEAAGYDRHRLAEHCARFVLQEVLIDGYFHADPHPGNLLVMPGEVIGVLDFGTMGRLDERDRINLARLFIVAVQLDVEGIVDQLQRMGVADYRVDREGLNRDLRRVLLQYYGLPIYEFNASEILKGLQPIIYEYHLRIPADYWLLIKTTVIMQGVGLGLDPDFDIFAAAQPYLGKIFRQLWLPSSWGPGLLRLGLEWKDLVTILPRQSTRLLDQLERGDFTVKAELPQLEPLMLQVDRLVSRIIYALLVAAMLVALAFLIPRLDFTWPWGLMTWLILGGFLLLLFLAARLAWLTVRTVRRKNRQG